MCCLLMFFRKIWIFSTSWWGKWLLQLREWWYWSWDSWCLLGWKIRCTFFWPWWFEQSFLKSVQNEQQLRTAKKCAKNCVGTDLQETAMFSFLKNTFYSFTAINHISERFLCCKHISNSCYSSSSSLTVQPDFRWCCCCITMEVTMTAKSLMVQPCNINCGDNDFILKSIWIELLLARKQQHHIYFKQTCIVKFIMLINHLLGKLPTRTPDT